MRHGHGARYSLPNNGAGGLSLSVRCPHCRGWVMELGPGKVSFVKALCTRCHRYVMVVPEDTFVEVVRLPTETDRAVHASEQLTSC